MLDLYKLGIFECVVEEGSFSAAAERLMMSQSGVSQHIRDLERTFGANLFERSRRGTKPTASGQMLYDYSRRILNLVSEAQITITDVANLPEGQVRVEATPGVSIYVLSEQVQAFREAYPRLSVSLETRITPEITRDLLARQADIGIIEGELAPGADSRLHIQELETIIQYAVVGRRHEFWNREQIEIDELDGQMFIMRQPASQSRIWLDEILAHHAVTPRINAEFDNVESIKRTVAAGSGLTILPRYAIHDEEEFGTLRALPIAGDPLQRTLKLVWDGRRHLSPVTRSLLAHLAQLYPVIGTTFAGQR
jgi:LysR family transcriptional regulator, low CO2-responsive transcriptional regulator